MLVKLESLNADFSVIRNHLKKAAMWSKVASKVRKWKDDCENDRLQACAKIIKSTTEASKNYFNKSLAIIQQLTRLLMISVFASFFRLMEEKISSSVDISYGNK